jgi:hypothetical protein
MTANFGLFQSVSVCFSLTGSDPVRLAIIPLWISGLGLWALFFAPELASDGGRKKFIRYQAVPAGTRRYTRSVGWGAHAPSRAVVGALADHKGRCLLRSQLETENFKLKTLLDCQRAHAHGSCASNFGRWTWDFGLFPIPPTNADTIRQTPVYVNPPIENNPANVVTNSGYGLFPEAVKSPIGAK